MKRKNVEIGILVLSIFALLLIFGCKSTDPNDPATWVDKLQSTKVKEREEAKRRIVSMKGPKTTALLVDAFKRDVTKKDIAWLLGEMKEKSAVTDLIGGIDFTVGKADDKETKKKNLINGKIGEALGKIGEKKAVKPLIRLLNRSKDNAVKLLVIHALGKLGSDDAVEALTKVYKNRTSDNFLVKNSIIALGDIASEKSLDTLLEAMFEERRGNSFYREASFAMYQIGKPAVDILMEGFNLNKEIIRNKMAKAKDPDKLKIAVYLKTATILGDLKATKAVDMLVDKLSFKSDYEDLQLMVIMTVASALGKIGDKRALEPIIKLLPEEEATARKHYSDALFEINDPSAIPALSKVIHIGEYDPRHAAAEALTKMGGENEITAIDGAIAKVKSDLAKFEKKSAGKKLNEDEQWFLDDMKKISPMFERAKRRLVAAKECKKNMQCWIGKLNDTKLDWRVREKAAIELGMIGDKKAIDPLLNIIGTDDLKVRLAVTWSLKRLETDKGIKKLEEVLSKKKMEAIRVNEELKRLLVDIKRRQG